MVTEKKTVLNAKNLLFLLIVILIPLGSPLSFSDNYILIVFIYSIILFIYHGKKIDLFILVILGFWCIVNYFSFQINETSFNLYTFLGATVKFLLPYFAIKVIGSSFMNKFSSTVYYLTIISLPIYFLRVVYPSIFELLNPIFEPLTAKFLKEQGWYSFFFTYNRTSLRNSGFMWEPGAFAMVINIAILNIISKEGFKIDKRIIILLFALLTTFSTMGYFSLIILIFIIVHVTKNYKLLYLISILLILFANDIYNLEFISGKINHYIENIGKSYYRGEAESYKINRFSMLLLSFKELYDYPFGYGVVPSKYVIEQYGTNVKGVGGISGIIRMWGAFGLLFIIFSTYRYYNLAASKRNYLFPLLSTIVILFSFFSNPVEKNPILYLIVFFPFVFKEFKK